MKKGADKCIDAFCRKIFIYNPTFVKLVKRNKKKVHISKKYFKRY